MKNTKNKTSVAWRSKIMLLVGFAFFVNPLLRGLDILPDVFGCIFVYFGLTQLAYFDGAIEKARKCMLYLLVVEAARLLLMRAVFLTTIGSNRMLAVTVFAIVDGIIYFMLIRQLFSGFNYYAMRNNCNVSLAKCDGTAFLTYLAFFVRIAASLIPELLSTVEIYLYAEDNIEIDFETLDAIAGLMSAKPLIEILFVIIALIVGIAWYISLCGFFKVFFCEAGEGLDKRYDAEYFSHPEIQRPKKLKSSIYIIYFALFFALDLIFDGIRIIPAAAMFFILFIATFAINEISSFTKTRRLALPAAAVLIAAEVFRAVFVPHGAIIVYETKIWIVAVNAVICLVAAPVCLLATRGFLSDVNELSKNLIGEEVKTNNAWVFYCASIVLWSAGYVVPYFYSYVSTLRFIASALFIWQTVKILGYVMEKEEERVALYGFEKKG